MFGKRTFLAGKFLGIWVLFVIASGFLWTAPDLVPHKKPKADLYVSEVTITPNPPRARKDMITIKVTVRNKGSKANSNLKFPCSLNMSVYSVDEAGFRVEGDNNLNAIPMYAYNIPKLEPGQSIQIAKTVTLRFSGLHRVSGVINTEGLELGEEIGANNSYQADFNALPPPAPADLVLESALLTPEGRLRLGMRNKGEEIPDADFNSSYIRIKIAGENDRILYLKEVDPRGFLKKGRGGIWTFGSQDRLYYNWPSSGYQGIQLQPGQSKTFQVIVDYNVRISDSNRNNNTKTVTLSRPN